MKNMIRIAAVCIFTIGVGIFTSTTSLAAQSPAPSVTTNSAAAAQSSLTAEQLIPMTVHEAWESSGKNEDKFFDMVSVLAELSAQKRGLTLPDNKEEGKKFGEFIKSHAKADTDQLLYVVVDRAVQKSAKSVVAAK